MDRPVSFRIRELEEPLALGNGWLLTRLSRAHCFYSVTYFTMGLPIVLMFVFLGKSLTLEGKSDGLRAYAGEWDVEILRTDGEV